MLIIQLRYAFSLILADQCINVRTHEGTSRRGLLQGLVSVTSYTHGTHGGTSPSDYLVAGTSPSVAGTSPL